MAFSALRSAINSSRNVWKNACPKMDHQTRNFINISRCTPSISVINSAHYSDRRQNVKKSKFYVSSESETDSDLEPLGRRGKSTFWRQKIRTFHSIVDVNKDGVVSFDDFKLLAERFIELGHLSEKHTEEFRNLLRDLWEKRWGPITPYNLITVEQFLEDMHHVINDKKMVRRAHAFLPYFFRAVDKDKSGEISVEEFKLFFTCLGLQGEDAIVAFRCMDDDNDNRITMREFVKHGREFFLSEDEGNVSKYFFGPLVVH